MVGSVRAHVESGALVVALGERADLLSVARLRRALARCSAHHPPYLLVDCSRARRSRRLASLLSAIVVFCNTRRPGITLVVAAPSPAARRLLRGRVALYPTPASALSALSAYRGHPGREHLRLEPEVSCASTARAMVRRFCEHRDLGDVVDDAELIVSELVSNAVQHAGTALDVTVSHYRRSLRIAVADRSPNLPRFGGGKPTSTSGEGTPGDALGLAVRGRGLDLVARSAARCGVMEGADGKVVWASVAVPRRRWRRTRASVAALSRVAAWRPVTRRRVTVAQLRPA